MATVTIAFLLLILSSIWVGFYQLIKQQGRMLLRLDELEKVAQAADSGARWRR